MSTLVQSDSQTENVKAVKSRLASLWKAAGLLAVVLMFGTVACALWLIAKLSKKVDDLSFQQTSSDYTRSNDLLSPDVGSIQFMQRGYSITFNNLNYSSSGLEIEGTIGNPTQMTISSLTLKLSARPYLYKSKDKLKNDPWLVFSGDEIGSGQTNIGYLFPGKTATFSLTIPNVKQTSDGFQIAASFAGERYSF